MGNHVLGRHFVDDDPKIDPHHLLHQLARQAEAERSRRAKIINAQGEQQASQKLLDAAQILAPVPQAMQLRYLATLFDIASERSSTIVFPFPIDLITAATRR
jgi:hypothetical protein